MACIKSLQDIETNAAILELRNKVANLQAQLEIQKTIVERKRSGNLLCSVAEDLYPGEQLDFLLSVLEQIRSRCPEDSRAREIVDSLLESNKPIGEGERRLKKLEKIFRQGVPTNQADISELQSLGFSYTPSRKHPKLRFYGKYMFVLPGTPGDNSRGGKNLLSEIGKCIAIKQKV